MSSVQLSNPDLLFPTYILKGVLWIIDGLALLILTFNVENMLFSVVNAWTTVKLTLAYYSIRR